MIILDSALRFNKKTSFALGARFVKKFFIPLSLFAQRDFISFKVGLTFCAYDVLRNKKRRMSA
jgi:hypothetical protein